MAVTEPAGMASDSRYYMDAILSCLTLLHAPANHITSISEEVTQLRAELKRHVTIDFVPPIENLGAYGVEVQVSEQPLLFPALTPRKGRLVTIEQIFAEDGSPLPRLSHSEHVYLSKLMLSERLWMTAVPWLAVDHDHARALVEGVQRRLHELVESHSREAQQILEELFDFGRLRVFRNTIRPPDEKRLYRLASLLAERYLVLIEFPGLLGDRHQVSYVYRQPFTSTPNRVRDRLKEYLGATRENTRFPVPLARRTDDYHFRMTAPAGHYFYQQGAYIAAPSDGIGGSHRALVLPGFASRLPGQACSTSERGALSDAHVYIANGSQSPSRFDVGLTSHELPLGSAGGAWLAVAITFSLTALLLALHEVSVNASNASGSDIPALLVALVSSSVGVSGAMYGSESRPAAALSKFAYLCCGLLGNAFAVWWVLTGAKMDKEQSFPARLARFAQDYGGVVVVAMLAALFVCMTWRLRRVVRSFQEVLSPNG